MSTILHQLLRDIIFFYSTSKFYTFYVTAYRKVSKKLSDNTAALQAFYL